MKPAITQTISLKVKTMWCKMDNVQLITQLRANKAPATAGANMLSMSHATTQQNVAYKNVFHAQNVAADSFLSTMMFKNAKWFHSTILKPLANKKKSTMMYQTQNAAKNGYV
jgi:hypothetical protein